MIDAKGKIKGRVSLIDIILILAVVALAAGILYRQTPAIQDMVNPNTPFYVTIQGDGVRHFIKDAVAEGDIMFRMHDRQPLGEVVAIEVVPAQTFLHHSDGTASLATMEQRYTLNITLRSIGTVREDTGFYLINGNDHMAPGREVSLHSNRVLIPNGRVIRVEQAGA